MEQNKIKYLDGMRGTAVAIVVFHHWILAFYGALYYLDPVQIHTKGQWELEIGRSFLVGLYSGQAYVALLFLLSAYVLSYRFFLQGDVSIVINSALRRYIRLAIPNLTSVVLAYIFLKLNWLQYSWEAAAVTKSGWLDAFFRFEANLFLAIKQGLWDGFFSYVPEVSYNPAMWTMAYELVGSFMVFSFLSLFGKLKRRWVIYIMMVLLFYDSYYIAFVLGLVVSDLHNSKGGERFRCYFINRRYLCWFFVLSGYLFLCYFDDNRNAWSALLNFQILRDMGFDLWVFYHSFGSMLFFIGVLFLPPIQRIFEGRVAQFLGRITYSLYLTHLSVLCSIGCFMFLTFLKQGWTYSLSVAGSLLFTAATTICVAYVMTVFTDEPSIRFSRYFQRRFFNNQ